MTFSSPPPPDWQACIKGYYYNPSKKDDLDDRDDGCLDCCVACNDDEAFCSEHTTIASIVVRQGYFRFNRSDPTIYPCPREKLCLESISNSSAAAAYNCRCVLSL